jgi:Pre-mRNA-splicing factor SF3A3, of SF3a complex, Prp9
VVLRGTAAYAYTCVLTHKLPDALTRICYIMLQVVFSGEEVYGKFFDLHSLYVRWVNMPQCTDKQLDYGAYLAGTLCYTVFMYTY